MRLQEEIMIEMREKERRTSSELRKFKGSEKERVFNRNTGRFKDRIGK